MGSSTSPSRVPRFRAGRVALAEVQGTVLAPSRIPGVHRLWTNVDGERPRTAPMPTAQGSGITDSVVHKPVDNL
jgi:hypothetical protein